MHRTKGMPGSALNRYGDRERRVAGTVTYALGHLPGRIKKIILHIGEPPPGYMQSCRHCEGSMLEMMNSYGSVTHIKCNTCGCEE